MATPDQEIGKLIIQYGPSPAGSANAAIPIDVINQRFEVRQDLLHLGRPADRTRPRYRAVSGAGVSSLRRNSRSASVRPQAGQPNTVSLEPDRPSPRESLTWAYSLTQVGALATPFAPVHDFKVSFKLWQRAPSPIESQWEIAPDYGPTRVVNIDDSIRQSDPNALATATVALPSMPNQHWLQVMGPASLSQFVALPIHSAWQSTVDVFVVRDFYEGLDWDDQRKSGFYPISVLVNTGNAPAEMLLGYLRTGDFGAARRVGEGIVDRAEEMVKLGDPSSAAIAGYYLLIAGELKRLHYWTRNLADWFPWIADGSVIHAWHLMRQDKPNLEQAREHLLQAEQRGLPIFTQGLRLLFDGLDFFSEKSPCDAVVIRARDRLQRYARAANWRALTTSFYGGNPSEPDLPIGFRG
jgi:hypothetical protein